MQSMSFVVVIFIIVLTALSYAVKSKPGKSNRKPDPEPVQKPQQRTYDRSYKDYKDKSYQQPAYNYNPVQTNKNRDTGKNTDISRRAEEIRNRNKNKTAAGNTVKKNPYQTPEEEVLAQKHLWEAAGVEAGDGAILASAKLNTYEVEKGNEADENVDLLGPVYDLMIKGPDTSIRARRDFEAEAAELMNRLTL